MPRQPRYAGMTRVTVPIGQQGRAGAWRAERLTRQIAETIQPLVAPHGVGVIVDARHLCMYMRGVQRRERSTVTSCLLGTFRDDARTRAELLALARAADQRTRDGGHTSGLRGTESVGLEHHAARAIRRSAPALPARLG